MKILQVCPGGYLTGRGGISEHVIRISEGLAKIGHEVTVFATNPGGFPQFEILNGVQIRRFKRFAPGGSFFFSAEMIGSLLMAEFDVVHGHGYHAFPVHLASLAKKCKFVVTTHFHGVGHSFMRNFFFKIFKPFGKFTIGRADKIIAVSEFERSLLCSYFKIDNKKVIVVPNGVNLNELKELKQSSHGFRSLLSVGRLERYKHMQDLVEVLPLLENNIFLEIVGKGPLKNFLENRASELGISERVKFFQDLSRKELLQKYKNSDLFVLLSEYESYSLVVAEALAVGLPCIVSATSALKEWIDSKRCFGISFPVERLKLAGLIKEVLKVDSSKMANYGGKKILDWSEVVKQLEKIYCDPLWR